MTLTLSLRRKKSLTPLLKSSNLNTQKRMAIPIPDGWRQLNTGEVISQGDLLSGMGTKPFVPAKNSIGKRYKIDSKLNAASVVITPIKAKQLECPADPTFSFAIENLSHSQKADIKSIILKWQNTTFRHYSTKYLSISFSGANNDGFYLLGSHKELSFFGGGVQSSETLYSRCKLISFEEFVTLFGKDVKLTTRKTGDLFFSFKFTAQPSY